MDRRRPLGRRPLARARVRARLLRQATGRTLLTPAGYRYRPLRAAVGPGALARGDRLLAQLYLRGGGRTRPGSADLLGRCRRSLAALYRTGRGRPGDRRDAPGPQARRALLRGRAALGDPRRRAAPSPSTACRAVRTLR